MTLSSLVGALQGVVCHPGSGFAVTPLLRVIACDLMSDVLVADGDDPLLVTSLATPQAVRTADIVGAAGIVLVNGKTPSDGMIKLAVEMDLSLVCTPFDLFRTCVVLGRELGLP